MKMPSNTRSRKPRKDDRPNLFRQFAVAFAAGLTMTAFSGIAQAAEDCPPQADISACAFLWKDVGEPVSRKDDPCDYAEICKPEFLTRYNFATRTPDWVMERLTKDIVTGTNKRPKVKFKPDPAVPEDKSAKDDDYARSLYARGHQAASADFKSNLDWMKQTFVFSNAVPQEGPGFNSSIWSQFEDMVRDLAVSRGEIIVITGPVYQDPQGKDIVIPESQNPCGREIVLPALKRKAVCGGKTGKGPNLACSEEEGVAIPAGLFKIIVDPGIGRVNAYLLPNIDHPSRRERGMTSEEYLKIWRVSVLNIEDRTGYKFLPEYDRHERRSQKESCPATMVR
ncbi:DNA/RNA non-specific endonuclease [Roseibium aggregatum]|uniref:DNA/RNA non-specific endonuclease n=1 Tax=Roseibium aggregatum TaxID=187304 RepID=A0A926S734_9HYPH|nr:DNA/RNA non-specific endonuclease [Roseibium aggregatum]MBD1547117.1 DNA/RNA non-specific endonuclease [Roseibium aggregatum]